MIVRGVIVALVAAMGFGVNTSASQVQLGAQVVEIMGDYRNGTATFRIDAPQACT